MSYFESCGSDLYSIELIILYQTLANESKIKKINDNGDKYSNESDQQRKLQYEIEDTFSRSSKMIRLDTLIQT